MWKQTSSGGNTGGGSSGGSGGGGSGGGGGGNGNSGSGTNPGTDTKPDPDDENGQGKPGGDSDSNKNNQVADPKVTGVAEMLNTKTHEAYLNGYEDGFFGPDRHLTRAEAAQMFYNLLLNKDVEITVSFTDVAEDQWYAKAVNTLASMDIIHGVGEGQFEPDRTITRAEFVAIVTRFAKASSDGFKGFGDVTADAWYYSAVRTAVNYGWITGYPDGSFKPDNTITRAEVVVVLNNMLDRKAIPVHISEDAIRAFLDVTKEHWAYDQIAEATTSH